MHQMMPLKSFLQFGLTEKGIASLKLDLIQFNIGNWDVLFLQITIFGTIQSLFDFFFQIDFLFLNLYYYYQ